VFVGERQLKISLHAGQAAIYNHPARFKVVAAGRRFGKSHLAAAIMAVMTLMDEWKGHKMTAENGVYYVAPTFGQAKRIMWPKLKALLGYEAQGGFIRNENVNEGWIELVNGRRMYIAGADNPDSLRGNGYQFVVLDEYADMKANVWSEIIDPALMDVEGDALFIGTPKGKNHFYKIFMGGLLKPEKDEQGRPADWSDWESFHFSSRDNPFLKEREINRLTSNATSEVVRQEIEASFISGGGKVLKPDWFPIIDDVPGVYVAGRLTGAADVYITVDLAGFKKVDGNKILRTDESVICETAVVGDKWYVLNVQHGHWDVREAALRIVNTGRKYSSARLGIEQGMSKEAVTPYLNDYMREFNRYMHVEELRHGGNKKHDRIAWALQGRGERRLIRLIKGPWNDHFIEQAADFPDPLAHDDILDALAYVDQLATVNFVEPSDIEEWQVLDIEAGY
jgi:phage terminase large subunit-like protein